MQREKRNYVPFTGALRALTQVGIGALETYPEGLTAVIAAKCVSNTVVTKQSIAKAFLVDRKTFSIRKNKDKALHSCFFLSCIVGSRCN
jgi:hypothetical protein